MSVEVFDRVGAFGILWLLLKMGCIPNGNSVNLSVMGERGKEIKVLVAIHYCILRDIVYSEKFILFEI